MNKYIEKLFGKFYHPLIWNLRRIKKYKFDYACFYRKIAKNAFVEKNSVIIFTRDYDCMSPSFERINKLLLLEGFAITIINRLKSETDYFDFINKLAVSNYLVINQACTIVNILPIRKETKVINLWHGCGALKKFGCSKMKSWNKGWYPFKRFNNLSLFTVSSEKCLSFYEDATRINRKSNILKPIGISRTDVFFDKNFLQECSKKRNSFTNKKIILYAPTLRGETLTDAYTPSFINFEKLKDALSEDFILIIKRHPDTLDKPYIIPDSCKDFVIDVSKDGSISELIVMSDILISDYSSLFFEWCLFDKPVIFLTPDFEQYVDERGFYIDFKSIVDKARCNNTEELIEMIQNISKYDFSFVKQIREDYMSACDGHSTERIVELMKSL